VSFKDSDWGVNLFTLPVRVERRSVPSIPQRLTEEFAAYFRAELQFHLDRDRVTGGGGRARRPRGAARRAAGAHRPRDEAGMLLLAARGGEVKALEDLVKLEAETKKAGGEDHQAALRALVEAAVLTGDEEKSLAAFSQLRGDQEGTLLARFLYAREMGDEKGALNFLERLLKITPPPPSLVSAKFGMLEAAGRKAEAKRLLRDWTGNFPARAGEARTMADALTGGGEGK
jgi:hypothetical protein